MQNQPYYWIGTNPVGDVGIYGSWISGDFRTTSIFDGNGNVVFQGTPLDQTAAFWTIGAFHTVYPANPYRIFILPAGTSTCADYADCIARFSVYTELNYSEKVSHCDYTYQTVAGTLDSYPVVQSSQCYTFQEEKIACGSSSSTPCQANTNYGDIVLVLLVILCIMFIGGISFLSSATKRKMTAKLE